MKKFLLLISLIIFSIINIYFVSSIDIYPSTEQKRNLSSKSYFGINCSLDSIKDSLMNQLKISDLPNVRKYKPKIAIIDTGIDYKNNYLKKSLYLPNKFKKQNSLNYGIDSTSINPTTEPQDVHGHGSHIAGLVLAINQNARILPIKYFNPLASSQENNDSFFRAFKFAVDSDVDIINISGGGASPIEKELALINKARKKGILIITALGNENSNIKNNPYYPASYAKENILTVMSHNEQMNKSFFSNWGDIAEISTLGDNLSSFGLSSGSCIVALSGTSQSTAIITGIASLIKGLNPSLSYFDIKEIIKYSSTSSGKLDLARTFQYPEFIQFIKNNQK